MEMALYLILIIGLLIGYALPFYAISELNPDIKNHATI